MKEAKGAKAKDVATDGDDVNIKYVSATTLKRGLSLRVIYFT